MCNITSPSKGCFMYIWYMIRICISFFSHGYSHLYKKGKEGFGVFNSQFQISGLWICPKREWLLKWGYVSLGMCLLIYTIFISILHISLGRHKGSLSRCVTYATEHFLEKQKHCSPTVWSTILISMICRFSDVDANIYLSVCIGLSLCLQCCGLCWWYQIRVLQTSAELDFLLQKPSSKILLMQDIQSWQI